MQSFLPGRCTTLPSKALESLGGVRFASKKGSTGARWQHVSKIPKHRGIKFQDGHFVQAGTNIVTQIRPNFFPGLNVGFARTGNLYAMLPGRVKVTCEKTNLNWDHTWVLRFYADRKDGPSFYKKYFNVIPEPQHNRFKLVDTV